MYVRNSANWVIERYQQTKNQYEKLVPFPHSLTVMAVVNKALYCIAIPRYSQLFLPHSQQETLGSWGLRILPGAAEISANLFLGACILNSLGHIYMERKNRQGALGAVVHIHND
jgi:hypothetical protein